MKRRDLQFSTSEKSECAYTNYSTNCVINRIVRICAMRQSEGGKSDGQMGKEIPPVSHVRIVRRLVTYVSSSNVKSNFCGGARIEITFRELPPTSESCDSTIFSACRALIREREREISRLPPMNTRWRIHARSS